MTVRRLFNVNLDASLDQVGRGTLPLMTAAHDHPDRLERWDRLCDAFTSNHVAHRVPIFGGALRGFGVPRHTSVRLFVFTQLRVAAKELLHARFRLRNDEKKKVTI